MIKILNVTSTVAKVNIEGTVSPFVMEKCINDAIKENNIDEDSILDINFVNSSKVIIVYKAKDSIVELDKKIEILEKLGYIPVNNLYVYAYEVNTVAIDMEKGIINIYDKDNKLANIKFSKSIDADAFKDVLKAKLKDVK